MDMFYTKENPKNNNKKTKAEQWDAAGSYFRLHVQEGCKVGDNWNEN